MISSVETHIYKEINDSAWESLRIFLLLFLMIILFGFFIAFYVFKDFLE